MKFQRVTNQHDHCLRFEFEEDKKTYIIYQFPTFRLMERLPLKKDDVRLTDDERSFLHKLTNKALEHIKHKNITIEKPANHTGKSSGRPKKNKK